MANRPSVATYVLTCLTKENGSVTWHLKSQPPYSSRTYVRSSRTKLHLGEHDRSELVEAFDQTIANWNLHLFDGFGSNDPDHIYNRIEYMASGLETKVVFLDHLSILLSGLDGINDEQKMIDQTMTNLDPLPRGQGFHYFLYLTYVGLLAMSPRGRSPRHT